MQIEEIDINIQITPENDPNPNRTSELENTLSAPLGTVRKYEPKRSNPMLSKVQKKNIR